MKKLVLLISPTGRGTNLKAILTAISQEKIKAKIEAVVSETQTAPGILIAKEHKISVIICKAKSELLVILDKLQPDYVVLCGWKQFITSTVIEKYKILNLHPGIIPDAVDVPFPAPDGSEALWNKGMYADQAVGNFIKTKATYAGSSIHFLTDEFDFGPVLGRTYEKIKPDDTIESLYNRLKKKENKLYIEVLEKLCN